MFDRYGVEILPTDMIQVLNQGGGRNRPRLQDKGVMSPILAMGRSRITFRDSDGLARSVEADMVGVLRRDRRPGFEGHKGDPKRAVIGTLALLGAPSSRYLIVRRAGGWYSVLTGREVSESDLRAQYTEADIVPASETAYRPPALAEVKLVSP